MQDTHDSDKKLHSLNRRWLQQMSRIYQRVEVPRKKKEKYDKQLFFRLKFEC